MYIVSKMLTVSPNILQENLGSFSGRVNGDFQKTSVQSGRLPEETIVWVHFPVPPVLFRFQFFPPSPSPESLFLNSSLSPSRPFPHGPLSPPPPSILSSPLVLVFPLPPLSSSSLAYDERPPQPPS